MSLIEAKLEKAMVIDDTGSPLNAPGTAATTDVSQKGKDKDTKKVKDPSYISLNCFLNVVRVYVSPIKDLKNVQR